MANAVEELRERLDTLLDCAVLAKDLDRWIYLDEALQVYRLWKRARAQGSPAAEPRSFRDPE